MGVCCLEEEDQEEGTKINPHIEGGVNNSLADQFP